MNSHYKEPDVEIDDKEFQIKVDDLMLFLKDPVHEEILQIYEEHVKPLSAVDFSKWENDFKTK